MEEMKKKGSEMEEIEKEKDSFFAALSKPENKELKGFLKNYAIIYAVNFAIFIIAVVLFFLIDEVELYFWIFFGLVIGAMLFNFIAYTILIPRGYHFLVKFLIPKFFKDLNKELKLEDSLVKFLAPKILKDLSKELNSEDLKKELIKELIKELEKDNKKKIT
jgi:hypothetical protein